MMPQIRFPEFEGEWMEKKIDDVVETVGGGTPDTTKKKYWNGDILWLTPTEIKEKYIFDSKRKITELGLQKSSAKILPKGTILFTSRATIGDVGIAMRECSTNQGFQSFLPNDNYNTDFLYNWILLNKKTFIRKSSGSTFLEISKSEISKINLTIPILPEQTRIATFLTAVDKRINLLQKKKTELEQYKKGVMQKLFSQTIRFKDENGKDFPDWEEKKLGEIGTFQTSSVDKLSKDNEEQVSLVNYMNVYRHENINNSTHKNLQIVTAKENQIKTSNLKRGDILFTPSSETPTDIGHSVVIFEDLKNTLFSYHLMRFRPNIELDLLYSHYFCNIPSVLKQLSSFATGSTRFTISVGNFSKVKVQLPSFDEQQKIANFLSAIDKKIEKTGQQIEASQQWKKGLLQKMFV